MEEVYDLAVIGGGINGCGIARDAAGRGAKVYLCEMNDLASGTSSWSTKLVHGGLRYLEYYEFRLVREALIEREVLWSIAPHVIEPLRLVLPYHKQLRPAWLLRLGLFLYDHIGGRKKLPPTRTLDLTTDETGEPLKPGLFSKGFEFSDCRVDDARLVVLNAMDARSHGAVIETRTQAIAASRSETGWDLTVSNRLTGATRIIHAKALVNAAGPWVADVMTHCTGTNIPAKVRLVQGSHIVVPRLYDHDRCYFFQNVDGRIFFAIPYQGDLTLIGTTDHDYEGDPSAVVATPSEISYLCDAASGYFRRPLSPDDVVWAFSGVRPLYDDGASEAKAATRDYVFELDSTQPHAPLLSIFGGKITTYRRLAEAALDRLALPVARKGQPAGWTGRFPLPGGDFEVTGVEDHIDSLRRQFSFLDEAFARRLITSYGSRAMMILGKATSVADLGRHFGASLTEAEVNYLISHEWVVSAEDVLWRRSKLGLRLNEEQVSALETYLKTATQNLPIGSSHPPHKP